MLAALSEDQGLISTTMLSASPVTLGPGDSTPSCGIHGHLSSCVHVCTPCPVCQSPDTDINNNLEALACVLCTAQEGGISSFWKEVFGGEQPQVCSLLEGASHSC